MRRYDIMMGLLLLGGCGDQQASTDGVRPRTKVAAKPVPNMVFDHLPLSGDLSTATAAGFGDCLAGIGDFPPRARQRRPACLAKGNRTIAR